MSETSKYTASAEDADRVLAAVDGDIVPVRLTLAQAIALPAGPELDALVAERVMGWKLGMRLRMHERDSSSDSWETCWSGPLGMPTNYRPSSRYRHDAGDFCPSTDIAVAWDVVERLSSNGLELTLNTGSKSPDTMVEFWSTLTGFTRRGIGDTATLAICRAALAGCWKD